MTALATIIVYAGTAALGLAAASRLLRRISPPWALALALLPCLVTGKALVTGSYFGPLDTAYAASPLSALDRPNVPAEPGSRMLTDVAFQMVPWQAAIRSDLRAGRAPLWNPFMLCGDVLAGAAQPAPFHPSTVISFLLPLATARTFQASLGLFIGALCAFLYLADLGMAPVFAFFGAAAWMLSFHFLFWTGWPQAQAFAPLPLVFAGLRRIARRDRGGFGAATTGLFFSLVAGHPESSAHVVLVGGGYFLWELAGAEWRGRAVAAAIGAGILAAALAAPAIFPVLEAIPQSREAARTAGRTSNSALEAGKSMVGAVFPDFYGRWPALPAAAPSFGSATIASVGGIALALAAIGLASPRREKWPLAILAVAALAVAAGLPGIADVVNRLPVLRAALNNRLGSASAFCLAALAALGLEELVRATIRRSILLPVWAVAVAAIGALRCRTLAARGIDPAPLAREAAFFAVGILVVFFVRWLGGRREGLTAVGALATFLVVRSLEIPRLSATYPAPAFYPRIPELAAIPQTPEPFRIAALGDALRPNQATLYGLEDARGYEGMTHARLAETYPLWSVAQPDWFNRVDDARRPFLAFLNVRWVAAEPSAPGPPGWREAARGKALAIYENPDVLPRAFVPRRIRFVADPAGTVAEMQQYTNFQDVAWVEAPGEAPREIANGRAEVAVRRDGPDLVLDVSADAPAWIVASETSWKGWRAIDGNRRLPVVTANHAFLAFRVPAGRQRIRLAYRPASFAAGEAVAGTALVLLAIMGTSRRARTAIRVPTGS